MKCCSTLLMLVVGVGLLSFGSLGCDAPSPPVASSAPATATPPPPPGSPPPPVAAPPTAGTPSSSTAPPVASPPASSPSPTATTTLPPPALPGSGNSSAKKPAAPELITSDPSLPVIGPLDIGAFADEFAADAAAANEKYARRRIRFNAGEVGGVGVNSRTSRLVSMEVCQPMTNFQKMVSLSVDSAYIRQGTLVIVEGDFQGIKYNLPHLANCQVTKVTP